MEHEKEHKEDKIEESTEEKEKSPKDEKTLIDKIKKDPWKASTIVLGVVCLIFLFNNLLGLTGSIVTGSIVSEGDAGEALAEFAKSQIGDIEIANVEKESGLYKIYYSSEQGEGIVYLTLDGKNLVNGLIPLSIINEEPPQEDSQPVGDYSEEDLEKIGVFVDCLAQKGLKIYGANWCGYTKSLVEIFGGFDIIAPIYVECTEEEELCSSEGVQGYPTIKLNGEAYSGTRTFGDFAEATSCQAPEISTVQTSSSDDVQCS